MRLSDFRNISIRWKVVAVTFAVVAVSLLLAGAGLLLHTRTVFEQDMTNRLTLLADVIGQNTTAALSFRDRRAAEETLAALGNDDRIMVAGVYDKNGVLFARYRRAGVELPIPEVPPAEGSAFEAERTRLVRPIEWKTQPIGTVYLVADTGEWATTMHGFLAILAALFAAVLAVGFFVSVGLQRLITRPIQELAQVMRRVGRERHYTLRAVKRGNDEIGVLVDGFNDMLGEIAKRRADVERTQHELHQRVAELDAEVAERRRAQAELRRSRDHLQNFVDNANIGLHWVGPEGIILWANRHEMEMLGYDTEEYIGSPIAAVHVDRDIADDILARLGRGEAVDGYEARLRCKDGSVRHVLINSSPYYDDAGVFVHSRCFTRDITERKQAEDALKRGEERYRTLVAATTSVVFSADASGRVVEPLPSWEAYTGQTWKNYRGVRWIAALHPMDRRRLRAAWLRAAAGEMFEAEVRVWHARSREHRYCIARGVPQRQVDGSVYEWIGTMMDIDDRKRAEERFRMAVEASPNAMIMIDQSGRIALVNRQLEALFGYTREELLGQPIEKLVPERMRHAHPTYRADFFRDPQARPMGSGRDLYGRHKNGREVPVEIGLSPFRTEQGVLCLASVIDITERRRADQELRRYTDELQRSNRELGQFAYVASHDLQEPLRAISGCVQLLQQRYRDKLDARANELIGHSVSGTLRMQALINDLLSYSRVSTRARPFERCDLSHPLQQALANLEAAIKESGAAVTVDAMPVTNVDPTQLTQLFQNLIGNAVKFRAERAPQIHVGAQRKNGGYLLYVQDNGIGIEPQYIDRIFGVFQRLHNRNKYPGTGIGLAICRKIAERHSGRIWVESVPGKGSTFYFTLPAGSAHNEGQPERHSSQQH